MNGHPKRTPSPPGVTSSTNKFIQDGLLLMEKEEKMKGGNRVGY